MAAEKTVRLFPDAGPMITLAYADALDLLLKPGWPVTVVDMVFHELTRNQTPTSQKIAAWVEKNALPLHTTRTFGRHKKLIADSPASRTANLGELAIQEAMNEMALLAEPTSCVFLFEDYKVAKASFLLPARCHKVSTRSYLLFLEEKGWLASAAKIERRAVTNGRRFAQLRFPP